MAEHDSTKDGCLPTIIVLSAVLGLPMVYASQTDFSTSEERNVAWLFAAPFLLYAGFKLFFFLFWCVCVSIDLWIANAPKRAERRRQRQAAAERREAAREERRRQREHDAEIVRARREASDYYENNKAVLADSVPRSLFTAELNATIPPSASRETAWNASRDVIAHLRTIIREESHERAKKAEREQRRQRRLDDFDRRINALREQITKIQASPLDAEIAQEETLGIEREILALNEEKHLFSALADEKDQER